LNFTKYINSTTPFILNKIIETDFKKPPRATMTYFPKNVMKLILSYNDTSAQRAEKKRQIASIKEARYLMESGRLLQRKINTLQWRKNIIEDGEYEEGEYEEGEYETCLEVMNEEVADLTRRRNDLYEQSHGTPDLRKAHRLIFRSRSNPNRGYENRKKGVIYWINGGAPCMNKIKDFRPEVLPLYKESILVRNNTMFELKQYCRDNKIKGYSKYSKQKLIGFIMKQNL